MPKLRNLSGIEIGKFLKQHGFVFERQKGSHMIFKKRSSHIINTATVPNHRTLDRGMTHAVFKQAMACIDNETVIKFFYTD